MTKSWWSTYLPRFLQPFGHHNLGLRFRVRPLQRRTFWTKRRTSQGTVITPDGSDQGDSITSGVAKSSRSIFGVDFENLGFSRRARRGSDTSLPARRRNRNTAASDRFARYRCRWCGWRDPLAWGHFCWFRRQTTLSVLVAIRRRRGEKFRWHFRSPAPRREFWIVSGFRSPTIFQRVVPAGKPSGRGHLVPPPTFADCRGVSPPGTQIIPATTSGVSLPEDHWNAFDIQRKTGDLLPGKRFALTGTGHFGPFDEKPAILRRVIGIRVQVKDAGKCLFITGGLLRDRDHGGEDHVSDAFVAWPSRRSCRKSPRRPRRAAPRLATIRDLDAD